MSPLGDPNLSLEGLRVPARVRSFILVFPERVAATTVGSFTQRDSAVSEREDAVLDRGSSGLRVYHGILLGKVGEGSTLPYSSIFTELEAIICIKALRGSVSPLGIA